MSNKIEGDFGSNCCFLNRLDRKIEFPLPDRRQKRLIFSTITTKMNLSDEVGTKIWICYDYYVEPLPSARLTWKIMWRDQTESPVPTSTPSARRLACTLSEKTGEQVDMQREERASWHSCSIPSRNQWLLTTCTPLIIWTLAKKAFSNSGLPRYIVLPKDFEAGYKNNIKKDESEHEFYK